MVFPWLTGLSLEGESGQSERPWRGQEGSPHGGWGERGAGAAGGWLRPEGEGVQRGAGLRNVAS